MTQKDKDLLLKDLCARLPYGVKVKIGLNFVQMVDVVGKNVCNKDAVNGWDFDKIEIKPCLRPMSSMTEEESKEYRMFIDYSYNDFTSESTPCVYVDKIMII